MSVPLFGVQTGARVPWPTCSANDTVADAPCNFRGIINPTNAVVRVRPEKIKIPLANSAGISYGLRTVLSHVILFIVGVYYLRVTNSYKMS